ncbi:MAG: Ku protein [Acidimicrobiia bacterium]|nr:Ku protein [Acidimicrobiia bacterium]
MNIPVKLFSAVSQKTVRFNQLDSTTGSRVRQKLVAEADGTEVTRDKIVKGYEVRPGDYVVIDDAELAALDPTAANTIDIEEFVDLADIDPIYFDRPYWLAPDKGNPKPYALLAEAMATSGRVAIARFVMRQKQHLAAIRSVDGRLVMSTMNWADEVNAPDAIGELDGVTDVEVSEREQLLAAQLIESLSAPFEPDKYHDTHREQVMALIDAKAAGATELVTSNAAADSNAVVDLMAALEASVSARTAAKERHPTGAASAAATRKAPAKRAASRKKAATGPAKPAARARKTA